MVTVKSACLESWERRSGTLGSRARPVSASMARGNSKQLDYYVNSLVKELRVRRDCDVEEIYLGNKRGLAKVDDFSILSRFRCLRSLWLNGNGIQCIPVGTFKTNCSVTELYLHDNLLSSVKDVLRPLICLEKLTLDNNQLTSLSEVSRECRTIQNLKHLRLSGNPLSQEPDYRLAAINGIPSVKVLDQVTVSDSERKSGLALFQPHREKIRQSISFGTRTPPPPEQIPKRQDFSLPRISPRLYRHKLPALRRPLSPPGSPKDKERFAKLVRKRSWMEFKTFDWSQRKPGKLNDKPDGQTVTVRFR